MNSKNFQILKLFLLVFSLVISSSTSLLAQEKQLSHKSRHGKLDTTGLIVESKDKLKKIQMYGSLRVYMGISCDGHFGVEDGASRIGITGKTNVTKGINAFALLEVGVNGIDNNLDMIFHADPGYAVGEFDQTVTSRLGEIGFETKYGNISWGKQWSPYYDVGGFSDQSMAFGGEAQGSFPGGTDGGVSGSGRAANSMQVRSSIKNFKVGLQAQFRDMSEGDVKFADTWAASLIYANPSGISLGLAYNKVRDGIEDPNPIQTKNGDETAIAGLLYHKKHLTLAGTFSVQSNHDQDQTQHLKL